MGMVESQVTGERTESGFSNDAQHRHLRPPGPARTISRSCYLAGARIDTRDQVSQASHPVLMGLATALIDCNVRSEDSGILFESFFSLSSNDLDQFSCLVAAVLVTLFQKTQHCT